LAPTGVDAASQVDAPEMTPTEPDRESLVTSAISAGLFAMVTVVV
jgi:hypothetical protein